MPASPAQRIRELFSAAYATYEAHAFGADEVLPLSNRSSRRWGNLGITVLDSLDTMALLGLEAPYGRALAWVEREFPERVRRGGDVPFFEVTIRALGGLLSAHSLSGEAIFLTKALDLGQRLATCFSSASGIPFGHVNLQGGGGGNAGWSGGASVLAELGTLQVRVRTRGERGQGRGC